MIEMRHLPVAVETMVQVRSTRLYYVMLCHVMSCHVMLWFCPDDVSMTGYKRQDSTSGIEVVKEGLV